MLPLVLPSPYEAIDAGAAADMMRLVNTLRAA